MDTAPAARRIALGTVLIGLAAFVLIAASRVPWEPFPGGMPAPVRASSVRFTRATPPEEEEIRMCLPPETALLSSTERKYCWR